MWKIMLAASLLGCGAGTSQAPVEVESLPRARAPSSMGAVELPMTAVEPSRVEGEKIVVPDDLEKHELREVGGGRAAGRFQLCLDVTGAPAFVGLVNSTGLPGYDRKIVAHMRRWRFQPIEHDGKVAPVCALVTFIYTQRG